MNSDDNIKKALAFKKIAVVGLSPDPARASNSVTKYMINQGYEVVGIRPGTSSLLDRPCYPSLMDAPAGFEVVDVFRASDAVSGIVDEIEKICAKAEATGSSAAKPKVLWLQEGVSDRAAELRAEKLGLIVIRDRCILKEHIRLARKS